MKKIIYFLPFLFTCCSLSSNKTEGEYLGIYGFYFVHRDTLMVEENAREKMNAFINDVHIDTECLAMPKVISKNYVLLSSLDSPTKIVLLANMSSCSIELKNTFKNKNLKQYMFTGIGYESTNGIGENYIHFERFIIYDNDKTLYSFEDPHW